MTTLTRTAALMFVVVVIGSQVAEPRSEVRGHTGIVSPIMPLIGERLTNQAATDSDFPGSPLLDGMSFDTLKDLIKALLTEEKPPTRGAREIAIFRQAAPAVVLLKTKEASGSGIILQNELVLTNRHIVAGIGAVQIFFKPDHLNQGELGAETRLGRVKVVDPERDLALITAESLPVNYKSLKISSRDDFDVGTDVYAIGHPLGYSWTFTQGIISGVRTIDTDGQHYTAIQTQTPINPGNSGGPLLNSELEVIGINTWIRDISTITKKQIAGENITIVRPAQGLNFAVSAHDLRGFVSDVANGKFTTLALQMPSTPTGCSGQIVFNGRTKLNDAGLKVFSLKCDGQADAWELFPDDKSKPVEFHLDPDRIGKSSIVVFSNPGTGKWDFSLWDFFRDQSFAVIGRHDGGRIQPSRFEFARS
jgi:S1-C subfamily serine protease